MYESPVQMIQDEMIRRMENDVMNVVHSYGIKVEKDELVKALMYDRHQYEKGYRDGVMKFAELVVIELAANYTTEYCHWIDDVVYKVKQELVGES